MMQMLPALLLSFASLCLALPHASGGDSKRAGPSGYVVVPAGGTVWTTIPAGDVGNVSIANFQYSGVQAPITNDPPYYTTSTKSLDIYAQLPDLTGPKYYLARGLGETSVNGPLYWDVNFVIPRTGFPLNAQGQFRLVVDEYQALEGTDYALTIIEFQSAAPLLTLDYTPTATAAPMPTGGPPGPSGQLVSPTGGEEIDIGESPFTGTVHIEYTGVSADFTRGSYYHFQTVGIDVYAQIPDGTGAKYYLAQGLAPGAPPYGPLSIQVNLGISFDAPHNAQNQTRIIVEETQFASEHNGPGQTITFRSAAPLVDLTYLYVQT